MQLWVGRVSDKLYVTCGLNHQGFVVSKKPPPRSSLRKETQDHWLREQAITNALKAEYNALMNQPVPNRLKALVEEIRERERAANKKKR